MIGSMNILNNNNLYPSPSTSTQTEGAFLLPPPHLPSQEEDANLFNSLAFAGTLLLQLGDANKNHRLEEKKKFFFENFFYFYFFLWSLILLKF